LAWNNALVVGSVPLIKSVRLLGGVHAVAVDGSAIDLPSASQRRLLAILALHSPRRLRSEWLADVLGISPGALRMSVSRLRTAIGATVLQTASTGYSVVTDVDVLQFSEAVARAADRDDRLRGLENALGLWIGPALEEFAGEEWAEGEVARLTELHAGTVDDYAEELISARRSADAVAVLEAQVAQHPYRDSSRGLLIRALASAGRQGDALELSHRPADRASGAGDMCSSEDDDDTRRASLAHHLCPSDRLGATVPSNSAR
jgi:DNA-binding SARP family transcriptional activator